MDKNKAINDEKLMKLQKEMNDILADSKANKEVKWYLAGLFDGINFMRKLLYD